MGLLEGCDLEQAALCLKQNLKSQTVGGRPPVAFSPLGSGVLRGDLGGTLPYFLDPIRGHLLHYIVMSPQSPLNDSISVFICLGCYNKNSINWVSYKQQKFVSPADLVSGESQLSFLDGSSHCSLMWQKEWGIHLEPLIRALTPFIRTPLSWPDHLPNFAPPNMLTVGKCFSIWDWGEGDTNIPSIATFPAFFSPSFIILIFWMGQSIVWENVLQFGFVW